MARCSGVDVPLKVVSDNGSTLAEMSVTVPVRAVKDGDGVQVGLAIEEEAFVSMLHRAVSAFVESVERDIGPESCVAGQAGRAPRVVVYGWRRRDAVDVLRKIENAFSSAVPGAVVEQVCRANGRERVTLTNGVVITAASPHSADRGVVIDVLLTEVRDVDDDTRLAVESTGGRIVHIDPLRDEVEALRAFVPAAG